MNIQENVVGGRFLTHNRGHKEKTEKSMCELIRFTHARFKNQRQGGGGK